MIRLFMIKPLINHLKKMNLLKKHLSSNKRYYLELRLRTCETYKPMDNRITLSAPTPQNGQTKLKVGAQRVNKD